MPDNDLFLQTVEAAYASGIERDRLPDALKKLSRLFGGVGAILQTIDRRTSRPIEFHSVGLPDPAPYIAEFARLNPRVPFVVRQRRGHVFCDYQFLAEGEMNNDPFYCEFLAPKGLRYFVGTLLENTEDRVVAISVQMTKRQGHADKREIALMQRLYHHFQRSHDAGERIRTAGRRLDILENAFNWVPDGVALLRADGEIAYANDTLLMLAQRVDGFRIVGGRIEFAESEARRSFAAALGAVGRIGDTSSDSVPADFAAARKGELPAYIVSVRPLMTAQSHACSHERASIMVFMRDPLWRNAANDRILQELFGLTNAEAHLAQALCTGTTTGDYARERRVSLNTVYSHLKRIREKTGCNGVPDLIRKFGEFNVPLRLS